ncbi:asparagine synthase-related protein [Sphingomonas sp. NSE70-1]|uniref:asparagine synthase (glutamine-hydrolyzing) n=1 Tax=Sphingomonas caseinilyticus TaxID=2908205 RepID=A0ABT0RRA9_9SPHN|nr:asparagine synthase-related protein [Sphingomonas caseinilyticus]MCL6697381.1 asparagine synthase-related protein [Sphingomonas caseinilyticus]
MLAFAWPWGRPADEGPQLLSQRLASSLCAGIGGHAGSASIGGLHFAYRELRSSAAKSRSWKPSAMPSGRIAAFHGYFDNAASIAAEMGADPSNPALLYGLAVERWGDDADRRIIGEYCAIIADPDSETLRLSRSPLRAPPLHYFHDEGLVAASSVPRAIFAAGVEQRLNEERLADSALLNFSDLEATYFEKLFKVPTGHIVELRRGRSRVLRQYYDLFAMPAVRLGGDAEYVARASELLDDGVRTCLAGFQRPGATLSAGLDSPQVALRALECMAADEALPTFTFHPETGYDERVQEYFLGNERPMVEAFAAMHPRLEPHFTANEGYEHDYRWNDFFHLMGAAPSGLSNMYVFHGLLSGAARERCDVLLLAEWGNYTFSDKGEWGYVEYFLTGRWRQLWRALTCINNDDRSVFGRFLLRCLMPLMPDFVWSAARKVAKPRHRSLLDLMQPLGSKYRKISGAERRLKQSGVGIERYQPRNRRHAQKMLFMNGDADAAEVYQAFEQMYGVALRDPMAYRPFVEFCFGLPVEMFMRDGRTRWLAKEMAKGIMPEEQRTNRLNGRWDADWLLRLGRRRSDLVAELDRLAKDERMAEMLDLPRLRAALEDWPEDTETDPQQFFAREFAVPRGLLTARFIDYVEGRNER